MKGNEVFDILKYPLATEKAVRAIEAENTLIFAVAKAATKSQIKWAIEKEYKVKVSNVRTLNDMKGVKKAYVRLDPSTLAVDVTSKLGLI
ncbi:MAG: 50S ribosomal protein L23 [Candidatus Nanoarchaeia archaeon]|jgi:large subunit ribosomal protein L23Ae|nr:50S ribosomal protein L23 [Candidatus Nanoarchaeia archaeon]|tara:strand:- start:707 stop:976 length:270 start_codon:yes stop_codon:yes gene_type:complete